jgi:signal transduction histidine kinase
LVQMFANLLENASRHTPSGTRIEISAARIGRAAVVEISDDGPGVPEALRTKVFQRFFRLEESRSTPGSGLGLSMVAAIAALHRTTVELTDNSPGLKVRVLFTAQET